MMNFLFYFMRNLAQFRILHLARLSTCLRCGGKYCTNLL